MRFAEIYSRTITPPETPYLPSFRINCNYAFEHVGVDYAGFVLYKVLYFTNYLCCD